MPARAGYCRSCYREVAEGVAVCAACTAQHSSPLQKVVIVLGLTAIPVLFTGIGSLNPKMCILGVAIAATAALVYAGLSLRT